MCKSDVKFLIFMAAFVALSFLNTIYHWIFYSAPPVILMMVLAAYSIWETKRGNKA